MPPLLAQLTNKDTKPIMLRESTWMLSNLCRGEPQPAFELVKVALPALSQLIKNVADDDDVLQARAGVRACIQSVHFTRPSFLRSRTRAGPSPTCLTAPTTRSRL